MAANLERLEKIDLIGPAIAEYKSQPLTPELVNKTWQTLWTEWGKRIGQTFDVPACDRTTEELVKLKKENKGVLLIPDNVSLVDLGKIFPQMQNWAVQEGTTVGNDHNKGGSIDIEMDLDSPNRNDTERGAAFSLEEEERNGQRLTTYIIGSQWSKLLTNHYFDENTFSSRLLGSRSDGSLVYAGFHSDGRLRVRVHWGLGNVMPDPRIGFRSEGVKKS